MDLAIIRRRAAVLRALRESLSTAGYLEVETPRLAATPIPESHIELFKTTLRRSGEEPRELYLLPSPEYWLKKLVAAGSGNIFEIGRAFRNLEESGPYHRHEFSMLEFYTVDADSADSIPITEGLLRSVAAVVPPELVDPTVRDALRESTPFPVMTMAEAFQTIGGVDLEKALSLPEMQEVLRERGMGVSSEERWEDLFHRYFLTYIEPELPTDRPLFLTDYPAAIPTLARQKKGTPWADRWELYFKGQELANCYGEERDPERIATFMAAEAAEKQAHSDEPHPVDPEYLQTPGERLPRCSGVALGVDRLVMTLGGLSSLNGVIYFGLSDIVGK